MTPDKIIDLVRKLKALSEGTAFEAEATAAAEKMQELLLKHNLTMDDVELAVEEPDSLGVTEVNVRLGEHFSSKDWKKELLFATAKYNFCSGLVGRNRGTIVGTKENVEVVKELLEFLIEQLERISTEALKERAVRSNDTRKYYNLLDAIEWGGKAPTPEFKATFEEHYGVRDWPDEGYGARLKMWREDYGISRTDLAKKLAGEEPSYNQEHGRTWRLNFLAGAVARITHRLHVNWARIKAEQEAVDPNRTQAIIVVHEHAIKDYITKTRPRLGTYNAPGRYGEGYVEGAAAGDTVSLSPKKRLTV